MGGGTAIRSQPANFARESNPASRLVKILLKHYIQYIKAIYKDKKEITHLSHTHSNLSQEKKPQCNRQRQPRRAARREIRTLKQSQLRAQENRSIDNEGDQGGAREGRHTHSSKKLRAKETTVQQAKANEGDKL